MSSAGYIAVAVVFIALLAIYAFNNQGLIKIPGAEDFNVSSIVEETEPEIGKGGSSFLVSNDSLVNYPTLVPNPRWNHMPIKVYMDTNTGEGLNGFGEDDIEYLRTALKVWEEKTDGLISFEEVDSKQEGEVIISWFQSLTEITGGKVVGEGGPTIAIDTGGTYTLIEGGEIFLIPTDNKCVGINRPVHEMGHVLGLGHAPPGYGDIMFSREISCQQNITEITIDAMNDLYKVPAGPDLIIGNVSAVKKGSYLDLSFTVNNIGLMDSLQSSMSYIGDGKEIESLSVPRFSVTPRIYPGSGIVLTITNVKVSSDLKELVLRLDEKNIINEMVERNNEAKVEFKST